jgi:outer membrane protein insertion porin family
MRRIARTLILGMILLGIAATPLMSQATRQYTIGNVNIISSKQLSTNVIKSILGLVPGAAYDPVQLRSGFVNLGRIYGSVGYVNFTPNPVEDIDEQKKVVNLTINIDEDRQFFVGRITFTGNTTTSDDVIRRELLVKEGQVFNATGWDLSLSRINQLGYFEEIRSGDVQIKPSATEPILDITVTVKEKERK